MKINYKFCVVRHCPDLTDQKPGSVPIALIATGEVRPGEGFVFVGVGKNPFLRSAAEPANLMDWFHRYGEGALSWRS